MTPRPDQAARDELERRTNIALRAATPPGTRAMDVLSTYARQTGLSALAYHELVRAAARAISSELEQGHRSHYCAEWMTPTGCSQCARIAYSVLEAIGLTPTSEETSP